MPSKLSNPQSIDDLLLFRMHRILALAGTNIRRLCEGQLGITWREWRLIATLRPAGTLLSSELAHQAQLDPARTSRGISSLVAKGLVVRQIVPSDHRKAHVSLTEKGQAMYEVFFPIVAELNHHLVKGLGDNELTVLDQSLLAIQQKAETMANIELLPKANRRRLGLRD
jgi:DNA-binding MarR family transcriptional regulator